MTSNPKSANTPNIFVKTLQVSEPTSGQDQPKVGKTTSLRSSTSCPARSWKTPSSCGSQLLALSLRISDIEIIYTSCGSWSLFVSKSLSIYLSVCLSVYLSIYIYIYIYLSIYQSIYLSMYISIYLSIYPSIHLSIYLSIYLFNLSLCLYLSIRYLPISLSLSLSLSLSPSLPLSLPSKHHLCPSHTEAASPRPSSRGFFSGAEPEPQALALPSLCSCSGDMRFIEAVSVL